MIKGIHILLISGALMTFDAAAYWEKKADFGSHGRHRGAAFSIGNKGYMGLGHYNGAGPNIVLKDWWEYDAGTNAWTQKADYIGNNGNGNYAPVTFTIGNFGYMAGGTLGDNMLYKFDPSLNAWSAVVACPTTPGNRDGWAIGDKGYYMSGNSVYEFNSVTETWATKSPAPFSAWSWNSAFVLNGKAYVKNSYSIWEYKQATDSWTSRAGFPGLSSAASVDLVHDGKGYIVTGYGSGLSDVNSEVWEYDPNANSWTFAGEFPGTSRRFASAFNIGERAYIGIGTNGTNFNDFFEFDPWADLEDSFDKNQFTTFPNPASDIINFKSNNVNTFSIEVFDLIGRKVFEERTNNGTISFSKGASNSGTYIYHVKVDGTIVHSNKFIFN